MLRLFTARECIDKEKFIFENIDGKAFVLVPNQYTLVAEEQALKYTGSACLLDIEILSLNRLGQRIMAEKGKENINVLNRYGRYMLLYKIINEHKDRLNIFGELANSNGFVDMVHDFIVDFKQQDCSFDDLVAIINDTDNPLLVEKLKELYMFLCEYENTMRGKYTDAEDYISIYISNIKDAKLFETHSVWLYGFDSLTPKYIDALVEMAKRTDVNIIINENDFGLHERVAGMLKHKAENEAVQVSRESITDLYKENNCVTIDFLEQNLFRQTGSNKGARPSFEQLGSELRLVECANPFYEAETAAAYVYELIRDCGYKMNEIVIICNDEGRRPVIERTFEEYGINLFVDARKTITDSVAARFIVSALEFVQYNYRTSALFMLLKTMLTGLECDEIEALENYALIYNIRGSMWTKPFKYGSSDYGDEFIKIENTRLRIMNALNKLVKLANEADSLKDFITRFELILDEEWNIGEKLEELALHQEETGFNEEAQNTRESYEACISTLEQIIEVLGEGKFNLKEMIELYKKGLESVDIGVIPPSLDGISIGPMIRTRPRPPRAMIILGANEGLLPKEPSKEGLFSVDEKVIFAERGFALGHLDELQMTEENVAMYRMISKPSEKLYISWSLSDSEGNDTKASTLVESIMSLLPELKVQKDIVSGGFSMKLVNNDEESLRHLLNYLKGRKSKEAPVEKIEADNISNSIIAWFEENKSQELAAAIEAAKNDNKLKKLPEDLTGRIFASRNGNYSFSASRLEKYFRCPFKHFVYYGLKPLEPREFKGESIEIGNLYHAALMEISRKIEEERRWTAVSGEEIKNMVHDTMTTIAGSYRDGLFISDKREEYHLERIIGICTEVAKCIAAQINSGKIKTSYFEEEFGRGKTFKAVEIEVDNKKVFIEGKIDRVDIFESGDARVIDYKTGNQKIDIEQMRVGYKMQLMVYMQGVKTNDYTPAGIFYYNIKDFNINIKSTAAKSVDEIVNDELDNAFKLTGLYIDEDKVIQEMPLAMVADLSNSKRGKKNCLSRESFEKLESDVISSISNISEGIVSGNIDISPTAVGSKLQNRECTYCDYKSICRFDRTYRGNRYREI